MPGAVFSIGALSQATGVPVSTIRTWERRYQFLEPERGAGGQRRYRSSHVDHVRMVKQALDMGLRPADVLTLPVDALVRLLAAEAPDAAPADADEDLTPAGDWRAWLAAAERLDGPCLERALQKAWADSGACAFFEERLVPFAHEIGDRWRRGRLCISVEHFASERIREFLCEKWKSLQPRGSGPWVVCGTLPGEKHCLGLHAATVVMAMGGWRVSFLGDSLPLAAFERAVRSISARAVLVSCSAATPTADVRKALTGLRAVLSPDVAVLAGGSGCPECSDIKHFDSLPPLLAWARATADSG